MQIIVCFCTKKAGWLIGITIYFTKYFDHSLKESEINCCCVIAIPVVICDSSHEINDLLLCMYMSDIPKV